LFHTEEFVILGQQHTVQLQEILIVSHTDLPIAHMPVDFFGQDAVGAAGELIHAGFKCV